MKGLSRGSGDDALRALLQQVQRGERSVDDALAGLDALHAQRASADLGFATVDHDRARRCGFPEVVFCQGKTPADTAAIAREILSRADRVLLTRATPDHAAAFSLNRRPERCRIRGLGRCCGARRRCHRGITSGS